MGKTQQPPAEREIVFQAVYGKRVVRTWVVRSRRPVRGNDDLEAYAQAHAPAVARQLDGWLVQSAWVKAASDGAPHEVRVNVSVDPEFTGERSAVGEFLDLRGSW